MKRKILLILVLLVLVVGCTSGKYDKKEALKFKNTYEALNGEKMGENEYRKLSIDENNPFVKTTDEEVVKKIENKDTFYVYFGDPKCPWCRSVIEEAIKISQKENA